MGTALVILAVATSFLALGYVIGRRRGREQGRVEVGWLTRPHTPETLESFPDPEVDGDPSTVQDATWVRTNAPGSNARWS